MMHFIYNNARDTKVDIIIGLDFLLTFIITEQKPMVTQLMYNICTEFPNECQNWVCSLPAHDETSSRLKK